jgi:hypothetical protein
MATRKDYRNAIIEQVPANEHMDSRDYHHKFSRKTFYLDGKKVDGKELLRQYNVDFPADRSYGRKENIGRIFAECDIPRFSYSSPETLRAFLLSAKSQNDWAQNETTMNELKDMEFQYEGIRVKGQMLFYHALVEELNKQNGTHYSFSSYLTNPELNRLLFSGLNNELMKRVFRGAQIPTRVYDVQDVKLNPELLRVFLLSQNDADGWKKWDGTVDDFGSMRFDILGLKNFTGNLLRRTYEEQTGEKYSLEELFENAHLEVSTDSSLLERKVQAHYNDIYSVFQKPSEVRKSLLSALSEDEWATPQKLEDLRKLKMTLDGREITLHTFLQLYGVHKHNEQTQKSTGNPSYRTLGEMQEDSELSKELHSNYDVLKEILDVAGIRYNFSLPNISNINLTDPSVLKRFLSNGEMCRVPVRTSSLNELNTTLFRKIRFRDPQTNLEVSGHSLMIYYSGHKYSSAHPGVTVNDAISKNKAGKSSKKVMKEIIKRAGLDKK